MNNVDILAEVVKRIKKGDLNYRIVIYLKKLGLSEDDQELIIKVAKQQIKENKLKTQPIINISIFVVSILLLLATVLSSVYILPYMGLYDFSKLLSVMGAVFIVLFGILAMRYYNSWQSEKIAPEKPIKYEFGVMFLMLVIPAIIFGFYSSFRYDRIKIEELDSNAVLAKGSIDSGQDLSDRGENFNSLFVSFTTKEGEKINTECKIPPKHRYSAIGKKVLLEYSSRYPKNIRLIVNRSMIKEKYGSEERMPGLNDLKTLLNMDNSRNMIINELDKIVYGWFYSKRQGAYVNDKYYLRINKYNNEVMLTSGSSGVSAIFQNLNYHYTPRTGEKVFSQHGVEYESSGYYILLSEKEQSYKKRGFSQTRTNYYIRLRGK